jgi:hypothetical protein
MSRVITSTSKSLGERAAFDRRWRGGGRFWRPRRVAAVIAALVAAAWLGVQAGSSGNQLYNPGPLTGAHAQWEHNCNVCHGGARGDAVASAGGSVFFKTVSDAACTKCHEAPIHHPNQTRLANLTTGTAAQCATCHVEHKGAASLTALSDAQCTQCHANIGPETSRAPKVATSITAFTASSHPHFGSSMRGTSGGLGAWVNPTRLQFDHAKHFGREGVQGCASCHTAEQGVVSTTRPWKGWATTAGSAPSGAPGAEADSGNSTVGSDNAYMRAVTYEEHCNRCHALSLPPPWPGGPELVHDDMAHVRLQLAQQLKQLPLVYAQQAAENPSLLEQKTGRPPRQKIEKIPQAQWIRGKLSDLAAGIDKVLKRQEGLPPGWPARDAKSTGGPSLAQLEYFVAFAAAQSCSKCHAVASATSAGPTTTSEAAGASVPESSGGGLTILPTGITHPVRRWFPAGRFSHRAHRNMTCADCHPNVGKEPDATSVFLPDLSPLATGPDPAGKSCVDCHHPPTSRERGAPASCVTCHNYHDHGREKHPTGIEGALPTPAPVPVTAATAPADAGAEPAAPGTGANPSPDAPSSQ